MKLTATGIGCIALSVILCLGAGYMALRVRAYDNQIVTLNNAIAAKDKTVEVSQGLYEKAAIESKNLRDLLDARDVQLAALGRELDRKGQELVTATGLVVRWKHDYEALVGATQTVDPQGRTRVEFSKDFGPILASGYTLTNPAEAFVKLHQQRPVRVSVAVSQDRSGLWHTYATSSEADMETEIELSSINPWFNARKWYERLSLTATVAAGREGGLAGIGAGVDISQFTVSAMAYDHTSAVLAPLLGVGMTWRPFQK